MASPRKPMRWTRCWRSGCSLMMANGYDHPGLCTVSVESPRRQRSLSTFALLDELPTDLLAHLAGRALVASSVLALEQCSSRLRRSLHAEEALLWRAQLERLCAEDAGSGAALERLSADALSHRALFRALHGSLEVKGWASSKDCGTGDMHAWWRCRAVGLRVTDAPDRELAHGQEQRACGAVQVRVQYAGYQESDDEWRAACSLRRSIPLDADFAQHVPRYVGEMVECSAPPCPGHPPALWEAQITDLDRSRRRRKLPAYPNRDVHALVQFRDFGREFDESIAADSRRLRAPGGGGGVLCGSLNGAPKDARRGCDTEARVASVAASRSCSHRDRGAGLRWAHARHAMDQWVQR